MREFDHSNNPFVGDATNPYSDYYRITVLPRLQAEENFRREMLSAQRNQARTQEETDLGPIIWLIALVVGLTWVVCLVLYRLTRHVARQVGGWVRQRESKAVVRDARRTQRPRHRQG